MHHHIHPWPSASRRYKVHRGKLLPCHAIAYMREHLQHLRKGWTHAWILMPALVYQGTQALGCLERESWSHVLARNGKGRYHISLYWSGPSWPLIWMHHHATWIENIIRSHSVSAFNAHALSSSFILPILINRHPHQRSLCVMNYVEIYIDHYFHHYRHFQSWLFKPGKIKTRSKRYGERNTWRRWKWNPSCSTQQTQKKERSGEAKTCVMIGCHPTNEPRIWSTCWRFERQTYLNVRLDNVALAAQNTFACHVSSKPDGPDGLYFVQSTCVARHTRSTDPMTLSVCFVVRAGCTHINTHTHASMHRKIITTLYRWHSFKRLVFRNHFP